MYAVDCAEELCRKKVPPRHAIRTGRDQETRWDVDARSVRNRRQFVLSLIGDSLTESSRTCQMNCPRSSPLESQGLYLHV